MVLQILSRVSADVPAETLQLFRTYCREFLLFAADRQLESARIIRLLQSQGISARLYKGTDFSSLLYNDIGMREFTDMDIIIREDQVTAVAAIMRAEGYNMQQEVYFNRHPAHFKRHIKDVTFSKRCPRGRSFSFEFHYRPTNPLTSIQYTFAALLGDDYLSRSFTYEDYYKLMLLNNGAGDFYPHLRSLIDMVLLYRKGPVHPPEALQPYAFLWQQLAETLLGIETGIPLSVHDRTYYLLLRRLKHPQAPGKYTFAEQAYVSITCGRNLRAKLQTAGRHLAFLFRPNGNDFEALQLPYFLYYFTKPVRLAANMLRRRRV
jgi:hypothetical protein